jgi:hypothetical protein
LLLQGEVAEEGPEEDAAQHKECEVEEVEEECGVCLEMLTDKGSKALGCGHRFHLVCISAWMQTSSSKGLASACPYCRASLEG